MTFGRYLLGVLLAAVALVPVGIGAFQLRSRLLPRWSGPPARLAEAVLGLTMLITVTELLGAVSLFRLAPVVTGLATAGTAASWWGHRRLQRVDPPIAAPSIADRARTQPGHRAALVALGATAVLFGTWSTRTITSLRDSMDGFDTLWYHLPVAARFVQAGSVTGLHFMEGQPITVFTPANAALPHALGILFLGNDVVSPLLNLAALAFALLAAWCIGRPFGQAPATLTAAALALALPGMVVSQAGEGYPEIPGLAALLASIALLANAGSLRKPGGLAALGVAALAAGLALGTKYTFVPPVAVLTVGVVVLSPRHTRLRRGTWWLLLVALSGGFWYLRNLFAVGNPLPWVGIHIGPIDLPSPPVRSRVTALAEYALDGSAWRDYLLPGLDGFFGPAWWAVLALAFTGLVLALSTRTGYVERIAALAGIAVVAVFVFGPQNQELAPGEPFFFSSNLRYLIPGIVLGLVVLPVVPLFDGRRWWWALAASGGLLAITEVNRKLWPLAPRTFESVRGIDTLAGAGLGLAMFMVGAYLILRHPTALTGRTSRVVAIAIAGSVTLAGFAIQTSYLRGRYANTQGLPRIYRWAQGVHDQRIAIVGELRQYPLFGKDLSNHVQYVGERGPNGGFAPFGDCAGWRHALNRGRYSYVLVAPESIPLSFGPAPELAWTQTDSAARLVMREGKASLFRLVRPLDPDACSSRR